MSPRADTTDYRSLLLNDTPLLDVRAPVEFAKGAFPSAINLPLLDDIQRQKVGACYKDKGQAAAIKLGNSLVSGKVKNDRMNQWRQFAEEHPNGFLYCFRGGLRSETVQRWLHEIGISYPRVGGGFKAMRTYLLSELTLCVKKSDFTLVSGMTGSGKTLVIKAIPRALDLEAHANHRGSTFGKMVSPQPAQIDFENALTIELIKMTSKGNHKVFVEDESRLIGRCCIPPDLQAAMRAAPLVIVEESLESRISVVVADYIVELGRQFADVYGEEGPIHHKERLKKDLLRLVKRLGHERHTACANALDAAFNEQWRTGSIDGHRDWIGMLLREYYDPMYQFQLTKRSGNIAFRGARKAAIAFIREQVYAEAIA